MNLVLAFIIFVNATHVHAGRFPGLKKTPRTYRSAQQKLSPLQLLDFALEKLGNRSRRGHRFTDITIPSAHFAQFEASIRNLTDILVPLMIELEQGRMDLPEITQIQSLLVDLRQIYLSEAFDIFADEFTSERPVFHPSFFPLSSYTVAPIQWTIEGIRDVTQGDSRFTIDQASHLLRTLYNFGIDQNDRTHKDFVLALSMVAGDALQE